MDNVHKPNDYNTMLVECAEVLSTSQSNNSRNISSCTSSVVEMKVTIILVQFMLRISEVSYSNIDQKIGYYEFHNFGFTQSPQKFRK
jgi:hypothetical protein